MFKPFKKRTDILKSQLEYIDDSFDKAPAAASTGLADVKAIYLSILINLVYPAELTLHVDNRTY